MIFLNPNFLIFMLLPLIILAFLIITNKRYLDRVFDKKMLKKMAIKRDKFGIFLKNIILFFVLFLFILALARPVIPKEEINLKSKKSSYALLLDISDSMLAKDVFPNRFEFAKHKMDMILKNVDAKFSIYLYNKKLYQVASLSSDTKGLRLLLEYLDASEYFSKKSDLYNALKKIPQKNVIIFSAFDQKLDTKKIKSLQKNLYAFVCSTKKGAAIFKDGKLLKENGKVVYSSFIDDIKKVAKIYEFSYSEDIDFDSFYEKGVSFSINEYEDIYFYFLVAALVMLFLLFFDLKLKFRANLLIIFIFFASYAKASLVDFIYLKKAKEAVLKKDFVKAREYYERLEKNKDPKIFFNLGLIYIKLKECKKAIRYFKKIVTDDKNLQYKTYYNIAVCYFYQKKYKLSYEFFLIAKDLKDTKEVKKSLKILSFYYKGKKKKEIKAGLIGDVRTDIKQIKLKTLIVPVEDR